jgi:hypothetical protein
MRIQISGAGLGACAQQRRALRNPIGAPERAGQGEAADLYGATAASTTVSPLVGAGALRLATAFDASTAEPGYGLLTRRRRRRAESPRAVAYTRDVLRRVADAS